MVTLLDDLIHKAHRYYLTDYDIRTCVNSICECDYRLTQNIKPDMDWLGVRSLLAIRLAKLLQRKKRKTLKRT